jgi:hypothetical protein
MADVTTTFAAKDESFASTVDKLNGRLQGFQGETQSFTSKVGEMAQSFASFAIPIAGIAAAFFGAKGAAAAFSDAIRIGGELNDLAARTGETAGELAVLQRAFQNAGMSGGEVGTMLNRLQRFMIEASEGGKTQIEAMEKLGLSYEDLKTKSPSEQLQILAQRIAAIDDPAQRSALAMQIFGRGGGEMMPLLRAMGVELDNARAQLGSYPEVINRANKALDDIGDNFAAISTKAREFVTGALVDIAPTIARASDELARMDFAAMGMKLSQTLQRVYDFFVGLWQNPKQIFGLFGSYLDAQLRLAGDTLASAFMTAVSALGNFLRELIERNAFKRLGDVLANAFLFGVTKFNLTLMNALEGAAKFWGGLWDLVTGRGSKDFAGKLYDVVQFFATDFGRAMIDPIGFIGNKVASALMGATAEASTDYQYAFDEASGAWVDRHKAGLEAAHAGAGQRLQSSAQDFGNILVDSTQAAATNTKLVEVNLFGGKKAVERTNEMAAEIAEQGRQYRGAMEGAVPPAIQIKEKLATLPQSGFGIRDALAEAFPLAAALRTEAVAMSQESQLFKSNINEAKIDAQVTADTLTGPQGLTEKFNEAMSQTDKLRDVIDRFIVAGENVALNLERASRMDQNARQYERSQDRAHGLRERGHHRTANQIERNATAKMTRDNIKEQMRQTAEDAKARAYQRAEDAKSFGETLQIRMKADKEYRKAMEDIAKLTKEKLNEAAFGLADSGAGAGAAIKSGGNRASRALKEAAAAVKEALVGSQQQGQLALENTLQACRDYLKNIDEKLPQNSLS